MINHFENVQERKIDISVFHCVICSKSLKIRHLLVLCYPRQTDFAINYFQFISLSSLAITVNNAGIFYSKSDCMFNFDSSMYLFCIFLILVKINLFTYLYFSSLSS